MWMSSKIRGASARVWKAVREAAGWFSRGYFLTKSRNAVATMRETFTEARHNGAVSSGLARSVGGDKFVYMSDIDGSDMLEEFKLYVSKLKEENPDSCAPVKVFLNSGVYGMYARTEMLAVMMYGGIPYILPVHRALDGIDENDAQFVSRNNSMVTRLFGGESNHVVSLGRVADSVSVTDYVMERVKSSPLFDSMDIDGSLVGMAISQGTMRSLGSVYLPGRYLYDIYSVDSTVSKAIRPYRDYTADRVDGTDGGMVGNEVILVGGDPDIVPVGMQTAPDGYTYDVWVPNDARYYSRASAAVSACALPLLGLSVDDEEYEESYALLLKMLLELDEEANGPRDEDAPPDILVNADEDTDTDEVPVLLDLPDYLS